MVKIKKRKGFSLIELLLAAVLFSGAMVSVIALVSSNINTINQSQKIKKFNSAIRNFNEYLTSDIEKAECIKGSEDGLKIFIYDKDCVNLQKSISVDSEGTFEEESKNNGQQSLLPDVIKIINFDNKKLFTVSDDSLVIIKARFIFRGDVPMESDYQTAIARRRW